MNILFLSEPSYPQHPGGAGKCAHLLAAGLAARGHDVWLVCPTGGGASVRERISGVDVHRVPLSTRRLTAEHGEAATARAILDYIKHKIPLNRVDVVHDLGGFLSYFYPVEFYLRTALDIPLVVHFQFLNLGYDLSVSPLGEDRFAPGILRLESGVDNRIQCFPVRIADSVIFPSFEEAALGQRLYRPPPGRVAVVPNPVDTRIHSDESSRTWRTRLAPSGEQLVVFGGRIDSPMKGADLVAAAFARIVSVRPNTRLVLLNSGVQVPPPFQRLASSLIPLGWIRDESDVAGIISAADVVVVPSRYEPFGMMCTEAMAAGVPVVATATGGLREMVVDGYNGFLLRARDAGRFEADLAHCVLQILADPQLRRRLGDNAQRSVRERYSVDSVVDTIETIYRLLPRPLSGSHVAAPVMSVVDEERYLSLLERMVGPEGRGAGEVVLKKWKVDIESRCLACNRGRLARESLALLTVSTRGNLKSYVQGTEWRDELYQTVEAACPLGLLQRSVVNRRKITRKAQTESD
jgi:glycogen(starch) synthase